MLQAVIPRATRCFVTRTVAMGWVLVLLVLGCGPTVVEVPKVSCRSPNPARAPVNIHEWKFNSVRAAILQAVPADSEGMPSHELAALVHAALSDDERERLGSVKYFTETVRLELEVRGELVRIPGTTIRLRRPE